MEKGDHLHNSGSPATTVCIVHVAVPTFIVKAITVLLLLVSINEQQIVATGEIEHSVGFETEEEKVIVVRNPPESRRQSSKPV